MHYKLNLSRKALVRTQTSSKTAYRPKHFSHLWSWTQNPAPRSRNCKFSV